MLDWEWYSDINTCRLFIHMLLKANWKEGKFQGTTVSRGSFVSSLPKLSEETKLTIREVRTAISHLKMTGELTVRSQSKYSVFTVVNYNQYQTNDMQNDSHLTCNRQSNDIQTTTIEEGKKERKEDIKKDTKKTFGVYRHVRLTDSQVERLILEYGQQLFDKAVNRLDEYIQETGKTYKDHNLTIRRWVIAAVKKEVENRGDNKFNSFPQRNYTSQDYADIEKALLRKGRSQ